MRLLNETQLDAFEGELRRYRVPVDDATRPGLSDAQIDATTRECGFPLPDEARMWWRWRNGTIAGFRRKLPAPWAESLSLAAACARSRELRQVAANTASHWPHGDPDLIWHPTWLPLIDTAQPIAIDCSGGVAAPAPVLFVDWQSIESFDKPRAASMGEMVGWWTDALQHGAWHWNKSDERWRTRTERLDPVIALNPLL